eukprot:CAMPEP_0206041838 /NCGR_PEP_ID=MMETSP1466-20131121/6199_1 /ASSEMBLY_ACC=CAM_ASM_001126 /TAXON_ID=44452 /ORGANISM="Pavlova gyrans, Strain CCMP608" /LENGTH=113 /DNA_ID=CAMNT_0053416541 /DNA_START=243 /DNA_END=581 /DNA_ORIENTATION=-
MPPRMVVIFVIGVGLARSRARGEARDVRFVAASQLRVFSWRGRRREGAILRAARHATCTSSRPAEPWGQVRAGSGRAQREGGGRDGSASASASAGRARGVGGAGERRVRRRRV